jgi:hypothetical protein
MSFREALTALAALNVAGIVHNYAVDAVPDVPHRGQLPALLVLPIELPEDGIRQERSPGFQAVAFASGAPTLTVAVTHLLLLAATTQSKGLRAHLPALVDSVDDYFAAFSADVTLGGRLREPAQVRVEPGVFTLNGIEYYGCAFRHTWLMTI